MRIFNKSTLRNFWNKSERKDSEQSLLFWYNIAKKAEWKTSADVKAMFSHASIISSDRIVFNIAGNKYRLVVKINYDAQMIFIRFIGTHSEYDKIDVKKV